MRRRERRRRGDGLRLQPVRRVGSPGVVGPRAVLSAVTLLRRRGRRAPGSHPQRPAPHASQAHLHTAALAALRQPERATAGPRHPLLARPRHPLLANCYRGTESHRSTASTSSDRHPALIES